MAFPDFLAGAFDRLQSLSFDLAAAAAIGLFGWYFAYVIGGKTAKFLERAKFDRKIKKLGLDKPVARFWRGGSAAKVYGKAAEIWVLLFFGMVCSGILRLDELSRILGAAALCFFNVFIAFLVFAAAVLLVDFGRFK